MEIKELVKRYIGAWTRQDVDGVLALMHEGAAYYDAFWRESCVGRDLVEYLRISFEDYTYRYRQVGDIIVTDSGVAFRYSAHEASDSKDDNVVFNGVEVLSVRDGKLLTVSNHYCDPRQDSIMELAELDATRHGESKYAENGLASKKFLQVKRQLSVLMDQDKLYLNPMLTPSQIADQIGCSIDQLYQVMNVDRRVDFHEYLNEYRARYARDMLREESATKNDLSDLATRVGFSTIEALNEAFEKSFGVSPEDYRRTHMQQKPDPIAPTP